MFQFNSLAFKLNQVDNCASKHSLTLKQITGCCNEENFARQFHFTVFTQRTTPFSHESVVVCHENYFLKIQLFKKPGSHVSVNFEICNDTSNLCFQGTSYFSLENLANWTADVYQCFKYYIAGFQDCHKFDSLLLLEMNIRRTNFTSFHWGIGAISSVAYALHQTYVNTHNEIECEESN